MNRAMALRARYDAVVASAIVAVLLLLGAPAGLLWSAVSPRLTVVLADATKIAKVALARVCAMSEVDVLITDNRAPQPVLDQIRELGCEVICV